MTPEGLARLDEVDRVMRQRHPDRAPMTDEQRQVIIRAFDHVAPFSATQRLRLLRILRTSERWPRLRAAAERDIAPASP